MLILSIKEFKLKEITTTIIKFKYKDSVGKLMYYSLNSKDKPFKYTLTFKSFISIWGDEVCNEEKFSNFNYDAHEELIRCINNKFNIRVLTDDFIYHLE